MDAWTVREWADHLERQARGELRAYLKKEFTRSALLAQGKSAELATTRLRVRTGRLRQSIRGIVDAREDDIRLILRAGGGAGRREVTYARIQEEGGVVVPKRRKYLAIPLDAALTPAGVLRGEFAAAPSLRAVPGLFVRRSSAGKLLLCRRTKAGGIEALFVLVKQSIIRPKHYLRDGLEYARSKLPEAIRDQMHVVVGERP